MKLTFNGNLMGLYPEYLQWLMESLVTWYTDNTLKLSIKHLEELVVGHNQRVCTEYQYDQYRI